MLLEIKGLEFLIGRTQILRSISMGIKEGELSASWDVMARAKVPS